MAKSNLIEEHLFLAELIAFDYANLPGCHWDEARSEASLALMRAADAFDPDKGEFVSFSSRVIRNALNSLYAKQLRLLRLFPKSIDDPILLAPIKNVGHLSPSSDGDFSIASPQDVRKDVRQRETSTVIDSLMNLLSPRERVIVGALKAGSSYAEIGDSLGISKQAAHKSAKSGLAKLRTGLDRLGYRGIASDGHLASRVSRKDHPPG
jgi:RNA polymerase sigma factor (sigma-70 family)